MKSLEFQRRFNQLKIILERKRGFCERNGQLKRDNHTLFLVKRVACHQPTNLLARKRRRKLSRNQFYFILKKSNKYGDHSITQNNP